ncbi:MAG: hypothetical protein ACK4FG_04680 [Brevundimonas sp.]
MPFPILIVWALGALAAGGAAGKGAQLVGDGKAADAKRVIKQTEAYLIEQRKVFEAENKRYLARLVSYSTLLRGMVGDHVDIKEEAPVELPQYLLDFWSRISAPWEGDTGYKPDDAVWRLSGAEQTIQRGIVAQARLHPVAASAAWAFLYAKKGVEYALEAGASFERVQAWAVECRSAADAQVEKLRRQFAMMERDWDDIVVPNAAAAISPPRDPVKLAPLIRMADIIEETARARISEPLASDGE